MERVVDEVEFKLDVTIGGDGDVMAVWLVMDGMDVVEASGWSGREEVVDGSGGGSDILGLYIVGVVEVRWMRWRV